MRHGLGAARRPLAIIAAALTLAGLAGCAPLGGAQDPDVTQPSLARPTGIGLRLNALPPPQDPVDVAVYSYADQTGQQKPEDNFSRFSNAVTQGGQHVLVDVLEDVGGEAWFNVVERIGLQDLLNERNLIDQSNAAYRGTQSSVLPPLRFAGIILEGGIVGYDSNVRTGGLGARLLGIGQSSEYRRDRLSVALRAVSVQTGEVLTSVMTEKTVYSILTEGDVFRFVAADEILELEGGYSQNEPTGLAVRQAIELAVYSLILEGAQENLWGFADPGVERRLLREYRQGRVLSRRPARGDAARS